MSDGSYPVELQRIEPRGLKIVWSDGRQRLYSIAQLRKACPCATCREKHAAAPPSLGTLPILSAAEARPLQIVAMRPVGNYAYGIAFSDDHSSGIYTFDYLRDLGTEAT
jgi:DUF971 family protein